MTKINRHSTVGFYHRRRFIFSQVLGFVCDDKFRAKKKIGYCDIYHSANRYSCGSTASSCPIILPRSIMWSFTRGRPLLGRELLALQGLSYQQDHLSGFSESQLGNLAGNALLTTRTADLNHCDIVCSYVMLNTVR